MASLESTQLLTNGAEIIAAGRTLGLTDDEALNTKRAALRRRVEARRADRAEREGNRALAEEFLAQDDANFRAKGGPTPFERQLANNSPVAADIDDAAWAFGEDPVWQMDSRGRRIGQEPRRPQDDDQFGIEKGNPEVRADKVRFDVIPETNLAKNEIAMQREGRARPQQGIGGMRDALARLQMAKDQYGFSAFGEKGIEMERVYNSLKDGLGDGQQRIRGQQQARELVARDNRQANVLAQIANEAKAAKEAEGIRNRFGGLPRQLAEEDIGRIGELRQLGAAGAAAHGVLATDNFQEVRGVNPDNFSTALPLRDEAGGIIGWNGRVGNQMVPIGEINAPTSQNLLNAPELGPAAQWVAGNQPDFGKNNVFGLPEADFGQAMGLVGDRVRGLKGFGFEGAGNPRNLGEFEKMLGAVVARGQRLGQNFNRFDPEARKNQVVQNPGVEEVLQKLGIGPADKQMIAFALMQQEMANANGVNQADKAAFAARQPRPAAQDPRIAMNVAEMRADNGMQLQRVRNEKVGGKEVRAGLAGISPDAVIKALADRGELMTTAAGGQQVLLPDAARAIEGARQARNDAQMPLIGNLEDNSMERARFVRGRDRGIGSEALAQKFGAARGAQAAEVERRFLEDKELRSKERGRKIDTIAAGQRGMDARMGQEAARVKQDLNDLEIGALARQAKVGREFDAPDRFVMDGDKIRRESGQKRGAILRLPSRDQFVNSDNVAAKPAIRKIKYKDGREVEVGVGKPNVRRPQVQPIREAAVAPSMSPDPSAMTGPARTPVNDAGGRSPGGQLALPPARSPRDLTPELRAELFALDGPRQGPERRRSNARFMGEPDGPNDRASVGNKARSGFDNVASTMNNFRTNPKYQTGRRVGYGGAALAGILGLSNMGNEEEEQMR